MVEKKEVKKATKKVEVKKEAKTIKVEKENKGSEKKFSIRGNVFVGKVTSAKAEKTVTVERELTQYIRKYERYRKIKSRVKAHNPPSMNAKEGDIVKIGETRKISKTKNFIVMEILGEEK